MHFLKRSSQRMHTASEMEQFDIMIGQLKRMKPRQLLQQAINFGMIVASALMIWKGLMVGESWRRLPVKRVCVRKRRCTCVVLLQCYVSVC